MVHESWREGLMMRFLVFVVLFAAVTVFTGLPMQAHHAISEIYDDERTVTLEGEVAWFMFGDPHSMMHVRVPGREGTHTWAVEWRGARKLKRLGWTAGALAQGDRVRLCGNPGRDPAAYRLHLLGVIRRGDDRLVSPADEDPCSLMELGGRRGSGPRDENLRIPSSSWLR
jgi:hypothetical protein